LEAIAVIDFETTGLSPSQGCRATEIAAVIWQDGRIVERYQSLMNPGVAIPPFITQLTGISNAMVRAAPAAEHVMREVAEFVATRPLLAHNASFDQKFWRAELARIALPNEQPFACSMLLARRLLPEAANHKLGFLTQWAGLPNTGKAHRAMADAEMAANLLGYLHQLLIERHGIQADHALLARLARVPNARLKDTLHSLRTPA